MCFARRGSREALVLNTLGLGGASLSLPGRPASAPAPAFSRSPASSMWLGNQAPTPQPRAPLDDVRESRRASGDRSLPPTQPALSPSPDTRPGHSPTPPSRSPQCVPLLVLWTSPRPLAPPPSPLQPARPASSPSLTTTSPALSAPQTPGPPHPSSTPLAPLPLPKISPTRTGHHFAALSPPRYLSTSDATTPSPASKSLPHPSPATPASLNLTTLPIIQNGPSSPSSSRRTALSPTPPPPQLLPAPSALEPCCPLRAPPVTPSAPTLILPPPATASSTLSTLSTPAVLQTSLALPALLLPRLTTLLPALLPMTALSLPIQTMPAIPPLAPSPHNQSGTRPLVYPPYPRCTATSSSAVSLTLSAPSSRSPLTSRASSQTLPAVIPATVSPPLRGIWWPLCESLALSCLDIILTHSQCRLFQPCQDVGGDG